MCIRDRDIEMTFKVLSGFAANPNVYGTVVIGNSCEGVQAPVLVERIKALTNKMCIRDRTWTIWLNVKYPARNMKRKILRTTLP